MTHSLISTVPFPGERRATSDNTTDDDERSAVKRVVKMPMTIQKVMAIGANSGKADTPHQSRSIGL